MSVLRNSAEKVCKIVESLNILFLCMTCMRPQHYDLTAMVDELIYAPTLNAKSRGIGGTALIVNRLVTYEVV